MQSIEQRTQTFAVQRRYRHWRFRQPEFRESSKRGIRVNTVNLVRKCQHIAVKAAQLVVQLVVTGDRPRLRIKHEQRQVRLFERRVNLPVDHVAKGILATKATGIDKADRMIANPHASVASVTGDTLDIGDKRVARSCQAIEERRFTDVRTPNQDNTVRHDRLGNRERAEPAAAVIAIQQPIGEQHRRKQATTDLGTTNKAPVGLRDEMHIAFPIPDG